LLHVHPKAELQNQKMSVARQELCKHVSTAKDHMTAKTDTHATIHEMLKAVFSVGSMLRLQKPGLIVLVLQPSAQGYKWATLFLEDTNTGT
jgi:hypothetical protein